MAKKISKLTDAQRAQIPAHVAKWIEIGHKTGEADWATWESGAKACYEYAGVEWPDRVVRVSSPIIGALAAPIANHLLGAAEVIGRKLHSDYRIRVAEVVDGAANGNDFAPYTSARHTAAAGAVAAVDRSVWDAVSLVVSAAMSERVSVRVDSPDAPIVDPSPQSGVLEAVTDAMRGVIEEAAAGVTTAGADTELLASGAINTAQRRAFDQIIDQIIDEVSKMSGYNSFVRGLAPIQGQVGATEDDIVEAVGDSIEMIENEIIGAVSTQAGGARGPNLAQAVSTGVEGVGSLEGELRAAVRRLIDAITPQLSFSTDLGTNAVYHDVQDASNEAIGSPVDGAIRHEVWDATAHAVSAGVSGLVPMTEDETLRAATVDLSFGTDQNIEALVWRIIRDAVAAALSDREVPVTITRFWRSLANGGETQSKAIRDAATKEMGDIIPVVTDENDALRIFLTGDLAGMIRQAVTASLSGALDPGIVAAIATAVAEAVSPAITGSALQSIMESSMFVREEMVNVVTGTATSIINQTDSGGLDTTRTEVLDAVRQVVYSALDMVDETVQVYSRAEQSLGFVNNAADNATGEMTDKLRHALYAAVYAATADDPRAAAYEAMSGAASSVGPILHDAVNEALKSKVRNEWGQYCGGQWWVSWQAWTSFFRDVCELELPGDLWDRDRAYADAQSSAGWWWPYRGFTMVTDRPRELWIEQVAPSGWGSHRMHNDRGPAISWSDDWKLYYWHGIRVPADLIEEGWTPEQILQCDNAEIRRCAIERYGWDRFTVDAGFKTVGESVPDPGNPGQELTLYDLPDEMRDMYAERARILVCSNASQDRDGTRRRFGLPVPIRFGDPIAAAAATFDLSPAEYVALQRAT